MPDRRLEIRARLALGAFTLDADAAFDLDGVTALFGPSGAGKSTLLRVIAGFARAEGIVACDGEVWADSAARHFVPPERRPVGFMFQDTRLFPHLDVRGNLVYAAKRAQGAGGIGIDDAVAALDLRPLLGHNVETLSGGERKRVALARTLLAAPRILLLDEPLTGLDANRKAGILPYLEALPRRFGIPAIHVTHDVEEVVRLADRVAVMADGRIHGVGTPGEILGRLDRELAHEFEPCAVVSARIAGYDADHHLTLLDLGGHRLSVPTVARAEPGASVRLRIRARDVALATERPRAISIQNVLPARVAEIAAEADSAFADVVLAVGDAHLRARVTRKAVGELGLVPGAEAYALVKSMSFDQA